MLIWCSVIESLCREFSDGVGGECLRLLNQMRAKLLLVQKRENQLSKAAGRKYSPTISLSELKLESLGEKQSQTGEKF